MLFVPNCKGSSELDVQNFALSSDGAEKSTLKAVAKTIYVAVGICALACLPPVPPADSS